MKICTIPILIQEHENSWWCIRPRWPTHSEIWKEEEK
jgi:hypothetical protein